MRVGYARVSTDDQKLDLQLQALQQAGCKRIFEDHGFSGAQMVRPGLTSMMRSLRAGQTLVVWRLDRLGRSLTGLVEIIDELGKRGIEFQSICEEVNTTSSGGRLIFHIMAALAEFERSLISERTKAGMLSAQIQGKHVGRPSTLSDLDTIAAVSDLRYGSLKTVAQKFGVSPRTLQRRIRKLHDSGDSCLISHKPAGAS